jgi:hypothetical protein
MMKKNIFLLVLMNGIAVSMSLAQNNDSDSIYYTPIPTPKPTRTLTRNDELKNSRSIVYFFTIQAGALVGCNDCSNGKEFTFSAATTQGITIGMRLRTGIGLGFDSYQNWQTFPVYGMVSWDLIGNKDKNAVFVQMSYGWAHPWFVRDGAYASYVADPFSDVQGGRTLNPQIGYRINYYDLKLSVAIGYKFQQIHYRKPGYYYPNCPQCDFPQLSFDDITQDMNRVQLVIGVGWK